MIDEHIDRGKLASVLRHSGIEVLEYRRKGHPEDTPIPDISGEDVDAVRRLMRANPDLGMVDLTDRLQVMIRDHDRPHTVAGEIGVAADDLMAEAAYYEETGEYWSKAHSIEIARWWRETGKTAVIKAVLEVTGGKRSATLAELHRLATGRSAELSDEPSPWGEW